MEINDFRVATGQRKGAGRGVFHLLKCACYRRGTGQTRGLVKGRQGSKLGIEGFSEPQSNQASGCLETPGGVERRQETRKLGLTRRRGLWWALQDTQPGFVKRDLGSLEAYYSNGPGGNGRRLPRL